MTNLADALQGNRQAVAAFLAAARNVPSARWAVPRAPGKWSPGQVAEHVARTLELNGELFGGAPPRGAPRFIRPVMRLGFNWVLRRGRFPGGSRSPAAMRPGPAPATPDVVLARLQAAAAALEARAAAHAGPLDHPFFGKVSVAALVRLQEIHTRHHMAQLAPLPAGTQRTGS